MFAFLVDPIQKTNCSYQLFLTRNPGSVVFMDPRWLQIYLYCLSNSSNTMYLPFKRVGKETVSVVCFFGHTGARGSSSEEQGRGAGEKATVQGPCPGAIAFEEKNTAFFLAFCPVRVRGEEDIVQKFHRSLNRSDHRNSP